jgi:hypothetical protein
VKKTWILWLLLVFAFCWEGCTGSVEDPNKTKKQETALTWHKDIRPLVEKHCVSCHTKGGLAPFTLTSLEDIKKHAASVRDAVVKKRMPPWPADNKCNEYSLNLAMKDTEIKTLTEWLDKGTPTGDPATYVAPKLKEKIKADFQIKLKMKEGYSPIQKPDDYRCFVLDWTATKTQYVTGFRMTPGNAKIVHHIIPYVIPKKKVAKLKELQNEDKAPGYSCFGGSRASGDWLGVWVPGTDSTIYPKGTGIKISEGSKIVLQVHYNVLSATPDPDKSIVELQVADKVDKEAMMVPVFNPTWGQKGGMKIPAGQTDVKHVWAADYGTYLKSEFIIYGVMPHMHLLGKSIKTVVKTKEGDKKCIVDVPKWDFNWQFYYPLSKPIRTRPGDTLMLECHFDNSQKNQPYINGKQRISQDVFGGEGTTDEMCIGIFYAVQVPLKKD